MFEDLNLLPPPLRNAIEMAAGAWRRENRPVPGSGSRGVDEACLTTLARELSVLAMLPLGAAHESRQKVIRALRSMHGSASHLASGPDGATVRSRSSSTIGSCHITHSNGAAMVPFGREGRAMAVVGGRGLKTSSLPLSHPLVVDPRTGSIEYVPMQGQAILGTMNPNYQRLPVQCTLHGLPSGRSRDSPSCRPWWAELCPRFLVSVVWDTAVSEHHPGSNPGPQHGGQIKQGRVSMVLAVLDTHEHRWHLVRPSGDAPPRSIGGTLANLIDVPGL